MRKKRRKLTEAQIREYRRKDKNHKNRKRYESKQKELFFAEYKKLYKKYGCYILSFYGSHISKQMRGEEIYTIRGHLKSLERDLNK